MTAFFDLLRPVWVLEQGPADGNHVKFTTSESFDRKSNGLGLRGFTLETADEIGGQTNRADGNRRQSGQLFTPTDSARCCCS